MEASQALVVRSSTDLAQVEELERILLGSADIPEVVSDPAQVSREIMAQLLAAESDEELEQMGAAIGWRELEGVPVEIKGFNWRPSTFEEGGGHRVFFVVRGTRLDTGENVVLTTGAGNVLAQLANMAKRGTLVGAVRAIHRAEKPTSNGYYPLWLTTPTQPSVQKAKEKAS